MKKLLQLKRWLTLAEAARYLSVLVGEEASEADILRLALDGELTLSVHFVNSTYAMCGTTIPLAEAKRETVPNLEGDGFFTFLRGTPIPGERVIQFEDKITTLNGVWDLPLFGAESLDVEHLYQTLTMGPSVEMFDLEGAFVTDGAGMYCKLMLRFQGDELPGKSILVSPPYHPNNFYPAGGLPDDSVLVVRTTALQALEARLLEAEKGRDRPIETRERTTLLVLIGALAELAKLDLKHPSKAAAAIESQTALMGARVASRTIEGHLNRVGEALESRA